MIIRSRAPLRLGLAGGGTDVSPYCDSYGGYVLNASIDRYSYAIIRILDEKIVRFIASDQQKEFEASHSDPLELDGTLNLHKAVYKAIVQRFNGGAPMPIELDTFCDAPVGSGLGSSSALVVVMIRAFVELLNLALDDYAIARLAYQIERKDCMLQGGRQDQYSAACGGFNFMEFYADDRAVINPLRIKSCTICELESSLLLLDTGISHNSSRIISDQSANVKAGYTDAIKGMNGLKNEAIYMKECLLKGDFKGIVETMQQGWESKKQTAKEVSNSLIEEIYHSALSAGALAGKISGAGGGGFIVFFVPPDKRMAVSRQLTRYGRLSNCHFTKQGAQAWRVEDYVPQD